MNEALRLIDQAITNLRRTNPATYSYLGIEITRLEGIRTRLIHQTFHSNEPPEIDWCMIPPYVRLASGHLG